MTDMVPAGIVDVAPWRSWSSTADAALEFLHAYLGWDVWLVTRVEGGRWIVLHAHPSTVVRPGTTLDWESSFCRQMISGDAPRLATVTAAVPAYAGIPVTARGYTQDVCVVTGHLDPDDPASRVRWQALAQGPGTLVVLMGHDRLPLLTRSLIRFGRDARTPAACIQDGTHTTQRVVVSTLEHLADDVAAAGLRAPVATVIGDVVRLRDSLRWFDTEEQP